MLLLRLEIVPMTMVFWMELVLLVRRGMVSETGESEDRIREGVHSKHKDNTAVGT